MKWSNLILDRDWYVRQSHQMDYDGGLVYHKHEKGAPGIVLSVYGITRYSKHWLGSPILCCVECKCPLPEEIFNKVKFLYSWLRFK